MTPTGQTVCLCMIVKNEAPVIARCLASARPLVDHWLVVDTGSTDGTQAIVREAMAGLPGELVERPWVDFGHNRSEALALARPLADYSLVIDADDVFEVPAAFTMPALDADSCMVDIKDSSIIYQRSQLFRNTLPWRYAGVLHEFPACDDAGSAGHLPVVMRRNHDGARRRDPSTYRNDAAILSRALETEPDSFLVSRYTFYLAQSWRDCGETEKALDAYLRRAALGYWQEEVYVALLQAARLKEGLKHPDDDVIAAYARATAVVPTRAEALHGAAKLCRAQNRFEEGYWLAKRGAGLSAPDGGLFVEPWILRIRAARRARRPRLLEWALRGRPRRLRATAPRRQDAGAHARAHRGEQAFRHRKAGAGRDRAGAAAGRCGWIVARGATRRSRPSEATRRPYPRTATPSSHRSCPARSARSRSSMSAPPPSARNNSTSRCSTGTSAV